MNPCPRCMIVEDQVLIGLSLEAFLEDSGYEVAGPFTSNAQALAHLERGTPNVALLDLVLKDGSAVRLARVLRSRGIPFAIYSGMPPGDDKPPELEGVPWLEKPVRREALSDALRQAMRATEEIRTSRESWKDEG